MSLIEIRPPQSVEEYHEACAMVEKVYREAGYVPDHVPMIHPGAIILAMKNQSIVGSIGLQGADQGLLPTERAFGFRGEAYSGYNRASLFEPQRLAIVDRADVGLIKGLIAGIIQHTTENYTGNHWFMTIKPTLAKVLWRYCHLQTDPLDFEVQPEAVPAHPGYWGTTPLPTSVRITRSQIDASFLRLSHELKDRVRFNLSSFDHHLDYGNEATYQQRRLLEPIAC